jgi:penicillin-binding protein 1A
MNQKKKTLPKASKKEPKKVIKNRFANFTLKRALMWGATVMVWGSILLGSVLIYYAYDLPDIEEATEIERRPGLTLLSADGGVIATSGDLYGEAIQVRNLPDYLPQAVMATEDRRFYDHFGVDIIGLARAVVTNLMSGHIRQGGSTLTQQVAKNLFLSPERSVKRKVQELLLAFWLEHKFTKDQIFTLYLNRVYFGAGAYGVEAAAKKYFSKSARHLSLYESAMIAGLLKAPSKYNPTSNPKLAAERTSVVLSNMVNAGYLTRAQADLAIRQKDKVISASKPHRIGRYYADWVMEQVRDYIGPANIDMTVVTTLDMGLQKMAEDRLRKILFKNAKAKKVSQAALVVLAPDGAVRAMVGGKSYGESQFNRATQARRQPGSAFKPFVFLTGLESGMTPQTIMKDEPISIEGWTPRNYSGQYLGDITLEKALAESVNTIAAKITQKVGPRKVVETAHRLGITSDLNAHASIALGSSEVSLLELTAAYGPFANGGYGVFPFGIETIKDTSGNVLYQRTGGGSGRIVEMKYIAQMNKMMKTVMTEGTGKKANFNRVLAGKSGTSQGYRDAWFMGYSADLVMGVWMGNDDETSMNNVSGGSLPAELWGQVMQASHETLPLKPLVGDEIPIVAEQTLGGFFSRLFGN